MQRMLAEEVPLDKPVWGVHNDASRGLEAAHDSAFGAECIALRHAVVLTVCGFRCPYPALAGSCLPRLACCSSARGQSRPVIALTFLMAT